MAEFQGNGTTITFAGAPAGLFAEIVDIVPLTGMTRGTIDVSTYATTGSMNYIAHALHDPGEATVSILFNTAIDPDTIMQTVKGACAITHSSATADVWTCDAIITGLSGSLPYHERAEQEVTIKWSGAWVVT